MKIKFILTILLLISFKALAADFKPGDGKVAFYNYHTGEYLELIYRKGSKVDPKAMKQIDHLFRSRSDEKEIAIDPKLIELLDNIQDHFGIRYLELISGYRSPALNKQLKDYGVNVAENSMHMEGKAADIHIDEITEEAVADYVRSLEAGGVGYYPSWDFVHVDTGEVRKWDLPDKPGKLNMAFRKSDKWQILTDKDVYLKGESIPFSVMNITRTAKTLDKKIQLEMYEKGEWKTVATLETCAGKSLKSGKSCEGNFMPEDLFGKFRLSIAGPDGFPHLATRSNEFYRKKY